jgi:threonine dehydratase
VTVSLADIREAAERIEGLVHRTSVLTSEKLNELTNAELFFKCEHLQKVGAFKARGAVNAVYSLDDNVIKQGVATHSSGNHGAALARAASLRGVPAFIVVPNNAKQVKKEAIVGYGAEIVSCEPTLKARESALEEVVEKTGATFIHPYDDDRIIAGQGTAALELVDQVPDLEAVIAPIGGGGLLAGCCVVAQEKGISVYGAEPDGADDAYRSLKSGEHVTSHVPDTICDGLLTTIGVRNLEIIRGVVDDILLTPDADTVKAMELIWTRMKQVVEPSSAIVLAAVLNNPELFRNRRIGLILTGGNVDPANLPFSGC